jgi:hypothetical protein
MVGAAFWLRASNFILRSGGADGSDKAFELGAGDAAEIYVPWRKKQEPATHIEPPDWEWAKSIAEQFHPAWVNLTSTVKKMIARNTCQVLGPGPQGPKSEFVVCWTPDAKYVGGTSQAMRIADAHGIPIFNLAKDGDVDRLQQFVEHQGG